MKKIIAVFGSLTSSVMCCQAAWKLCETENGWWWAFLISGLFLALLGCGMAATEDKEENI
jgi:hypothetical protein